jgi:signal transduction histidine kinase
VGSAVETPSSQAWLVHLWHGLFGATLAMPTIIAVTDPELPVGTKITVVALVVAVILAHWLVLARHPQWWEERIGRLVAYWALICGLMAILASQHGSFTITLYGLYPWMFMTLGWWGMVPIVGLTALMGWALGGWGSNQSMVTNLLATAGLAALVAVFVNAISRQSEQRRDALAALAATRAELAEASRHSGVLAERERLARELHDTVAQGFISVVTQLESAEQVLDADQPGATDQARTRLRTARETARGSLEELRRSVRALRPDLLESASLPQALLELVRRWSDEVGIPAELRTTGAPAPLHPDAELALLRIAQEALTNVRRHARASRVVITLSFLDDLVTLDVDDDGVGFAAGGPAEPQLRADGGFGLIGMRERLAAAGGTLAIESAPGQGTTIAASVPA